MTRNSGNNRIKSTEATRRVSNFLSLKTLSLRKGGGTPHPPLRGTLSHKGRGERSWVLRAGAAPPTSPLVGEVGPKGRVRGIYNFI